MASLALSLLVSIILIGNSSSQNETETTTVPISTTSTRASSNETESESLTSRCDPKCIFDAPYISSVNWKQFPKNCRTVCASPLHIGVDTVLKEKQLINIFKNMKHLIGALFVSNSKYKSGKILASLETVDCDNTGFFQWTMNRNMTEIGLPNLTTVACRILISSNEKMTRLNMPKFVPTPSSTSNFSRIDIVINNNTAPDFCVTIREMTNLITNDNVDIIKMPDKYCAVSMNSTTDDKTCKSDNVTLATMDSGCVQVQGDVIIEADDEEHTEKLSFVKNIFGSLIISGTNLSNIDFLDALERVVALEEDQPAIQVDYNPNLSNVSFPNLKRVRANIRNAIVFRNNSEELLNDPSICWSIRNVLNSSDVWIPTIDGEQCEKIEENSKNSGSRFLLTRTQFMYLFFSVIFFKFK